MTEPFESAVRAQRRVWSLRRAGASPNGPEARQAVNGLVSVLRRLSPEELAAFEAWKSREQADEGIQA